MDTLTELAIKYGADKWGKHHYTPVYFDLFKDRRETVKKVVEIGVGEGASLRMWQDFFPNAWIYGADNDPERIFAEQNMEVFRCNQSSEEDLIELINEIGGDIDLVVDDGSHKPEDQVFTAWKMMMMLNPGVIYVIEDVSDSNIADKLGNYGAKVIECGKRYDDRLIILKHI